MDKPAIKIENLSKLYRLGEFGTGTLSHDLNRWWARLRGREDPYSVIGQTNVRENKAESDYVWALKDIDLEIRQGEIVGIIGRNGAGKSTLLKLITRITSPTTGSIRLNGRVASLLEVGTGMHQEMTARENIYLNGAILGMKHREISRKFDEIIDFAGCQLYVDTPIKRFSSGMRIRLGFAVAAFLEPEILIVDEVLAVGDIEFQQKAVGRMKTVSEREGLTVLFVSHNMTSIRNLCQRAVLLERGSISCDSTDVNSVIHQHLFAQEGDEMRSSISVEHSTHPEILSIHRVYLSDNDGNAIAGPVRGGADIYINIDATIYDPDSSMEIGYDLYTEDGVMVYRSMSSYADKEDQLVLQQGHTLLRSKIPTEILNEGGHRADVLACLHKRMWLYPPNSDISVSFNLQGLASRSIFLDDAIPGIVAPIPVWEMERL